MASYRSLTGCLACKTKRKKCDETKPHCLRCQKSRIACPGYTYIEHPGRPNSKPRTLPAPRTLGGQSRAIAHQGTSWTNTQKPGLQLPDQLSPASELTISEAPYSVVGNSVLANGGTTSEAINISNERTPSYSFSGSLQHTSVFNASAGPALNATGPFPTLSRASAIIPMTSGQASLLEALFSLGQPPDLNPIPQRPQPTSDPRLPIANWPPPDRKRHDDVAMHDDDPAGIVSVILCQLVLDKTVESNAFPFVLQGYTAWINRLALEPLKMRGIARDFVYDQFRDGDQFRWIVVLLGNIGSRIGSVEFLEGKYNPILSVLQTLVRRELGAVKLPPQYQRPALTKVLDSAIETMLILFYVSPLREAIIIRQETASIFRQLCPGPPDAPIYLRSLPQSSMGRLWHFVELDILFSVSSDMPMLFRYEVDIPHSQSSDPSQSVAAIQSEGIVPWLHGVPNQIVLLLTKMKAIREDGLTPNGKTVAALERDIRDFQPYSGSSSERFLAVMRFVVQECWRQAAYIYLYMAVCGDPSDTPRVKEAFKRYMKLLKGTRPGRSPDEFLIVTFQVTSLAAQRQHDREIIRQRALGLYTRDRTRIATVFITPLMDDVWARADADGRPVMWSDVTVSRNQLLGVS